MSRGWKALLGIAVAAAGFFCLNYTNGFGIEHHAEWARAKGLPEPAYPIFVAGAALLAIGGVLVGHALGSARRASSA